MQHIIPFPVLKFLHSPPKRWVLRDFVFTWPGSLFPGGRVFATYYSPFSRGLDVFPYTVRKVCIKSPCTSISANSAVLAVHGLLIQTLVFICLSGAHPCNAVLLFPVFTRAWEGFIFHRLLLEINYNAAMPIIKVQQLDRSTWLIDMIVINES